MTEPAPTPPAAQDAAWRASVDAYWRRNLRLMGVLLALWAAAGLGCGALLADRLNRLVVAGFPLGFWFAQQGSVVVFVSLIAVYAVAMDRLDRRHHAELEALGRGRGSEPS